MNPPSDHGQAIQNTNGQQDGDTANDTNEPPTSVSQEQLCAICENSINPFKKEIEDIYDNHVDTIDSIAEGTTVLITIKDTHRAYNNICKDVIKMIEERINQIFDIDAIVSSTGTVFNGSIATTNEKRDLVRKSLISRLTKSLEYTDEEMNAKEKRKVGKAKPIEKAKPAENAKPNDNNDPSRQSSSVEPSPNQTTNDIKGYTKEYDRCLRGKRCNYSEFSGGVPCHFLHGDEVIPPFQKAFNARRVKDWKNAGNCRKCPFGIFCGDIRCINVHDGQGCRCMDEDKSIKKCIHE